MSIKLKFYPFQLKFIHPFTVSGFSRNETPIVLIELEYDGVVGFGEATMPPYLGETQESVMTFLGKIELRKIHDLFDIELIHTYIDSIQEGNNAAKAGFDIALHDLIGKIKGKTVSELYEIERVPQLSSFTIGIDTPALMVNKVSEAKELGFKVLKVKLGSADDHQIMDEILKVWDGPFSIDANQGWEVKEEALDFVHFLKENGASFIEQPFAKSDFNSSAWLTERSPLPIIADESIKRFVDLQQIQHSFHGINVKLMKSTGIFEAFQMIKEARKLNLKVVTGCMAESSCAVTAMANLASLADWVDLDGPFLINNDPFKGVELEDGFLTIPTVNGIGVIK